MSPAPVRTMPILSAIPTNGNAPQSIQGHAIGGSFGAPQVAPHIQPMQNAGMMLLVLGGFVLGVLACIPLLALFAKCMLRPPNW